MLRHTQPLNAPGLPCKQIHTAALAIADVTAKTVQSSKSVGTGQAVLHANNTKKKQKFLSCVTLSCIKLGVLKSLQLKCWSEVVGVLVVPCSCIFYLIRFT